MLQERLRDLKASRVSTKEALAASERDNTLLRKTVREQQLSLAASQSVVTRLLVRTDRAPPHLCDHCTLIDDSYPIFFFSLLEWRAVQPTELNVDLPRHELGRPAHNAS